EGGSLTVSTQGGVSVDQAKVIKTDIVADNGVIHVVDRVLMPN
ncbi:MAG TPA: fasciclin domain-containing protein, partial [Burkholderiaceae bacterium]|nr:fasciclin domain-containing protein [Burkholderiaceae bacterium]